MLKKINILLLLFIVYTSLNAKAGERNEVLIEKSSSLSFDDPTKLDDSFFAINCPSNIFESVTSNCEKSITWSSPTSDNPNVVEIISIPSSGSLFRLGQTTVIVQGKNTVGTVIETCSFTVNISLSDPASFIFPDVQCAPNIEVDLLNSCNRTVFWPEPVSPCSEITFTKTAVPLVTQFDIGPNQVFYRANLDGVEIASCSFTITLNDNIDPIFETCPSNITLDANGSCEAVALWDEPIAADNCGFEPLLSSNIASGSSFPLGSTTVTYTATDEGGNEAFCSFVVTVEDSTAPEFNNLPVEVRVSAGTNCTAIANWDLITATDACSGSTVTKNSSFNSGDSFSLGETEISYSAEDNEGNINTATFKVIVEDNTAPTVSDCPSTIIASADYNCESIVNWTAPSFSDSCDENLQITSSHNTGDTFSIGDTEVNYTATDESGNQTSCTFIVRVEDNLAPTIVFMPDNIITSASDNNCEAIVSWNEIIAEDNCSNQVQISTNFNSGDIFPLGETTVEITASDTNNNEVISTFTITVEDQTAPIVSNCPSDITVFAKGNCESIAMWEPPSFSDNCDANLTITSTHEPRDKFPLGSTLVTYTATDFAGNQSTCSFNVIVEDDQAPVFTTCIADLILSANEECESIAQWASPQVTDNCGTDISIESNYSSGDVFPLGTTVVTYTATDDTGNSSTCVFNVIVEDTSAPVITFCPSALTLSARENCTGTAQWETPVFEDCSNITISSNFQIGEPLPLGISTIEYTATDAGGLSTSCSFQVEVKDQIAPVVENCPSNINVTLSDSCEVLVEWDEPLTSDNCSIVNTSSNYESGSTFPVGTTTIEYEFSDEAGNKSFCTFDIVVIDESDILINNCPADVTVKADNNNMAVVSWEAPIANVACSEISVTSSHSPGDNFDIGETTVTYTFIKESGESESCSFLVTVSPIKLQIEINKLISPNGDGNNDTWQIDGIEQFPENQVIIVDRWGTEIYSAKGYNNNEVVWTGENTGGEVVPRGTYYYFISVKNDQEAITRKGFIEILK